MNIYQKFLEKINIAFATGDLEFFASHLTEDVKWKIVGETSIKGKAAFIDYIKTIEPYEISKMKIKHTITNSNTAAVDGKMKAETKDGDVKTFGFCDIYEFTGENNPKIKSITSYAIKEED